MCIRLDYVGSCLCCNSASWSALLAETPALTHRLAYKKEQQCLWRSAGNLSEAHCPAVATALQRVPSTRSSNIHHPPPPGRRQAGRSSGKATPDGQNAGSPAGVGGRRVRGWKDGGRVLAKEKVNRLTVNWNTVQPCSHYFLSVWYKKDETKEMGFSCVVPPQASKF